jgi:small nuclear ribonucleoprotein (snRNP)-like protein
MAGAKAAYDKFLGKEVVVDMSPPVVYIGVLAAADDYFLTLENADVHDLRNAVTSKEIYVMETARNGLQPNRKSVSLRQSEILSLSALADVIVY